jgi:hypothetical protein
MITFLPGVHIRKGIVELISNSSQIDCAVAFWGRGATDLFKSTRQKSIRIICDLMSGACNPDVIRELMNLGAEIKMVDGMHAKIYLDPSGSNNRFSKRICQWPWRRGHRDKQRG